MQNQQQFDYQKQLQEQENYANTIGAYANDYMAEAKRLLASGISADDDRVKMLLAKHYEKEKEQKAATDTNNMSAATAYNYYRQGLLTKQDLINMGYAY